MFDSTVVDYYTVVPGGKSLSYTKCWTPDYCYTITCSTLSCSVGGNASEYTTTGV